MKCRFCGSANTKHIENKHAEATSAVFDHLGLDADLHSFESFACDDCGNINQINKKQLKELGIEIGQTTAEQPVPQETPTEQPQPTEQPTPDFSQ